MANKKAEKFSNFHRVLILSLLEKNKKGYSVSELSIKLELSRVAVYHHLRWLEKRGLAKPENPADSVGNPVKWNVTDKADPVPLKILEWANKMFKFDKELKSSSFKP